MSVLQIFFWYCSIGGEVKFFYWANLHVPFCSDINGIRDARIPDVGEHGQDEEPRKTDFCCVVWDIISANQFDFLLFLAKPCVFCLCPGKIVMFIGHIVLYSLLMIPVRTGQHTLIAG